MFNLAVFRLYDYIMVLFYFVSRLEQVSQEAVYKYSEWINNINKTIKLASLSRANAR